MIDLFIILGFFALLYGITVQVVRLAGGILNVFLRLFGR